MKFFHRSAVACGSEAPYTAFRQSQQDECLVGMEIVPAAMPPGRRLLPPSALVPFFSSDTTEPSAVMRKMDINWILGCFNPPKGQSLPEYQQTRGLPNWSPTYPGWFRLFYQIVVSLGKRSSQIDCALPSETSESTSQMSQDIENTKFQPSQIDRGNARINRFAKIRISSPEQ